MGKYMRKAKITEDVAVMELLSQSSLGVRTRAKTLALQRLQSTAPQPPNPESSYLQLRSRRLEKVFPQLNDPRKPQMAQSDVRDQNPRTSARLASVNLGSAASVSISRSKNGDGAICECFTTASKGDEMENHDDLNIETSFGENNLDLDGRDRTRESTPCSLMGESITAGTPSSTTRQTASGVTGGRVQNAMLRNIPTSLEMEEFFASAELHYQRLFTHKYNFDVVNDLPLPGRYEWVRVNY